MSCATCWFEVMLELGVDLDGVVPQRLTDVLAADANILVTMGCGEECPVVPGVERKDWPIDDPKGQAVEQVRQIRDDVAGRVRALLVERGWLRSPPAFQAVGGPPEDW
jgi:arsenate reductase